MEDTGNIKSKTHYIKILESGGVKYEDDDVYLHVEDMKRFAPAFNNVPFIITHKIVEDSKQDMQDDIILGYVTDTWFNDEGFIKENTGEQVEKDYWIWGKVTILPEKKEILERYKKLLDINFQSNITCNVSCHYKIIREQPNYEKAGFTYSRRVLELESNHVAIVETPKFDGAVLFNGKNININNMTEKKEDSYSVPASFFNSFLSKFNGKNNQDDEGKKKEEDKINAKEIMDKLNNFEKRLSAIEEKGKEKEGKNNQDDEGKKKEEDKEKKENGEDNVKEETPKKEEKENNKQNSAINEAYNNYVNGVATETPKTTVIVSGTTLGQKMFSKINN